jgi:hypothetical protein
MGAIQVTFDPALWSAGFGSGWGANGYDCFTVKADKDGTSLWAFEYFGAGWARVNATTGAIIQQDALFGTPGSSNSLDSRESGTVALWVQDASGFYYTSCANVIYKFHIPSPTGTYTPDATLLNGYAVIDATLDYSAQTSYVEDWTSWTVAGVTYLAGTSTHEVTPVSARVYVFNATTMTYVGMYDGTVDNLKTGNMCFADSSGILWACCNQVPAHTGQPDAPPNDIGANLVRWDPASGATAGVLNSTSVEYIPASVHGMPFTPYFAGYAPATNSVILATWHATNSGDVSVVSMDTWLQEALHLNDLKFFINIEADENEGGFDQGVQDGLLMIEGSNASPTQVGGLLEIIDPTTLAIQSTIDCVALIAAAGLPNQAESTSFNNVQNGFISAVDEDASGNVTVTTTANSFTVGSHVWFNGLVGASFLNTGHGGNPIMAVTSATSTSFTGVDPFGVNGPYSGSEIPPYAYAYMRGTSIPPLSSFAWSKPSQAVGFTFNFEGSPLYISAPDTPIEDGMTTITVGGNTYSLVTIPPFPGVSDISLTMTDSVAIVQSPFAPAQVQTQTWQGGDMWSLDFTLPKMSRQSAAPWRGWMAELIGQQNVFQMGDPYCTTPLGAALGAPTCLTTGTFNLINSNSLVTVGWTGSVDGQLKSGDYIQLGYHLHVVTEDVNSDGAGTATIKIWPSLRESPTLGTALILSNTKGLFRLASNTRAWHGDFTKLLQISFKATEVR